MNLKYCRDCRPDVLDALEAKVVSLQVRGLTATKVRGVGDYTDLLARVHLTDGVKVEIFVEASRVEMVTEAIMDVAHSDLPGAGIVGACRWKNFSTFVPGPEFFQMGLEV